MLKMYKEKSRICNQQRQATKKTGPQESSLMRDATTKKKCDSSTKAIPANMMSKARLAIPYPLRVKLSNSSICGCRLSSQFGRRDFVAHPGGASLPGRMGLRHQGS